MGYGLTMNDRNPPKIGHKLDDLRALTAESLQDIINDNERVRIAVVNQNGVTYTTAEGPHEISATVGMVVTDQRVAFVTPTGGGNIEASLPYGEFAAVSIERGESDVVELTLTDGERWTYELPGPDKSVTETIITHLRWIGEVRRRMLQAESDVEMAAGEIRSHADDMNWDSARERYDSIRDRLDRLISAVHLTEPIPDQVLAPELTEIERTLETAHVRLHIEHSKSKLELGQYLVENEDYNRVRDVLQEAYDLYQTAEGQSAAVERGDAFEFGTQRDLNTDLQSLHWRIQTIAAEPVRQGHEAMIRADTTDDFEDELTHLETAFRRFSHVLSMDSSDHERSLIGDPERIRAHRETAGEDLVHLHTEVARRRWNEGAERGRDGEDKVALQFCQKAVEQLERASELAVEFDHERLAELDSRLAKMHETVTELRETARPPDTDNNGPESDAAGADGERTATTGTEQQTPTGTEPSAAADGDEETLPNEDRIPSVRDVTEIDTHHEITLDLSGEAETIDADGDAVSDDEHTADEAGATDDEDAADGSESTPDGDEERAIDDPLKPSANWQSPDVE
jgi:hypothetical protein